MFDWLEDKNNSKINKTQLFIAIMIIAYLLKGNNVLIKLIIIVLLIIIAWNVNIGFNLKR